MNRAAIFDFNGTIFWDTEINYISWNICIKRWFNREYTREEYFNLNGRTTEETLIQVFNKPLTKQFLEEKEAEKNIEYLRVMETNSDDIKLAPGFVEFAKHLIDNGITIAIATSAPPSLMDEYEKFFHLSNLFKKEYIISSDGSHASKPDPAVYIKAIDILNIPASSSIVFEDTKSGILSAYRANVKKVISVSSPGSDLETIKDMKETSMIIPNYYNLNIDELFE